MTCSEETPLLYDGERSLKTTMFNMFLGSLGIVLCVMLIVLPIIITSMLLMSTHHNGDVELSSSIVMRKLRHRYAEKIASEALENEVTVVQYEFVLPEVSIDNTIPGEEDDSKIKGDSQIIDDTHLK
jgi:hypothetical protein